MAKPKLLIKYCGVWGSSSATRELVKSVVPKLKDKVQLELVKQYGAHPEIRINGKKLSADYNSVESLEKSLTDALSKAARWKESRVTLMIPPLERNVIEEDEGREAPT